MFLLYGASPTRLAVPGEPSKGSVVLVAPSEHCPFEEFISQGLTDGAEGTLPLEE